MAREVLNVCSHHALKDILEDLEITNSSELTINRILDDQFLKKAERSPLPSVTKEPKESKDIIMLLSSSDDESIKDESLTAIWTGNGTRTKINKDSGRGRSVLPFPRDPLVSLSPPNSPRSSRNHAKQKREDITENQFDPWENDDYVHMANTRSTKIYRFPSLSRKQTSPEHSNTAIIELFPLSRQPIANSTRPFIRDTPMDDDAFSEWDYTLLHSPDRTRKNILFSSSAIAPPTCKAKSRSLDLALSDLEADASLSPPRIETYIHCSKRGSPAASDLLPRTPTRLNTTSSRSSMIAEIILDDDDDEDIQDRNLSSWRSSLERSLSPPSAFNSDTDSETERLMEDVFSGNRKSRAKKTPGLSSKAPKKTKTKSVSLEELDDWNDDSFGNIESMSIEEEIAHRAAQRRNRGSRKTSDSGSDRPRRSAQRRKRQKTDAERQEDDRRKAEEKAQKDAEKVEKDALKAAKALEAKRLRDLKDEEKEAEIKARRELKIANRLTTKSDSVKEMVVCIEYSLQQSKVGRALQHYWTMLECESVAIRGLESDIAIPLNTLGSIEGIARETCPLRNMIFWRRRVDRRFNQEQDMFVGTHKLEVDLEPFALIYLTGKEFALHIELGQLRTNLEAVKKDMVARRNKDNLRKYGPSYESAPEDKIQRVIYLIEGMETFIRGLKTNTNKNFRQAVLAQMQPDQLSGVGSNKNSLDNLEDPVVDRERIEQEFLWLQLEEDCLIIHTHDNEDSAQAVVSLTEQIGLAPYKNHQSKSELNICVEGVKSGNDFEDIWIKCLQQIHMVTLPVAKAIATEFPTIRSLYEEYRQCNSVAEAQSLLKDIQLPNRSRFGGRHIPNRQKCKTVRTFAQLFYHSPKALLGAIGNCPTPLSFCVLLKFEPDNTKDGKNVLKAIAGLKNKVPAIISVQLGVNKNDLSKGFIHGLTMAFKNKEDLDRYEKSESHVDLLENCLHSRLEDILIFDYKVE
ncbi:hypothetical protein BGZ93_006184 [Podila epicladia]|nr:hypothetical protein BGZ93_006184 [Podila epicladia]